MIINILHKPYPILLNKWKVIIYVSLFIAIFLSIFQPFGLQFVTIDNKTAVLLGYGLVTGLILIFDLIIIPYIFKTQFKEEKWTIGKQILLLLFIVFTISLGNYTYSILFSVSSWVGIRGLLIFILFTFPIAIIPIVGITFITQNIHLKKNLKLSAQINKEIEGNHPDENSTLPLIFTSGNQEYSYILSNIIFIESEGNYVQINYLDKGIVKTQLIRKTLKDINASNVERVLFKCHRAFMININHVEKVRGNSHGITITMAHVNKQIPVSRNNTKAFTELLNSTKA